MASSTARIEANRRNALKSTGPKSAEGKARSRANALKHGLAGSGTVLPPDDVAKVAEMEAKLAIDFPPVNELVASLVHRYAVLSVRLDRCADHDAAMTARRVRYAIADRDNRRHDEVAALGQRLGDEPADAVRRLCQTPEGIDWLLRRWRDLRAEVAATAVPGPDLIGRAGALLGMTPGEARLSGWAERCRALAGGEPGAPDEPNRGRAWIVAEVDEEVAVLEALRAEVDDEDEAADRAEAPARALFDFGPESERMRRYEAAAERHLLRTLKELRQALAEAGVPKEPKPAPPPAQAAAPKPAPMPAPPSPAQVLTSFLAAERRILGSLPDLERPLPAGYGDFLDVAATPAAAAAVRKPRDAKAKRPKLR